MSEDFLSAALDGRASDTTANACPVGHHLALRPQLRALLLGGSQKQELTLEEGRKP